MSGKTDDSKHDLPRYSGIPTLLRAPYSESIDDLDIALVGVPYDGGVTFRPGARHDPRFKALAAGLESDTLGGRLDAINVFFEQIEAIELAGLVLPPNLSQLRSIFLSSRAR